MKPTVTTAIILARVNYHEADRILTLLTLDHGKMRVIAKGVRKVRSKMAGGVELFSISELSVLRGRGEVGTLVSSRLIQHYDQIAKDIERTMFGYEFLKLINKITEDNSGEEYFDLTRQVLEALDDATVPLTLVKLWADLRLLVTTGHSPNISTDIQSQKLDVNQTYDFDSASMAFSKHPDGPYRAAHIKLLRVMVSTPASKLGLLKGVEAYINSCQQFAVAMRKSTLHV